MLAAMALNLIAGPPNSGRTGAVLDGFRAAAARDPVLVVPTVDDVERFERELTGGGAALIGASICTFDRLFALVARATGATAGPALTRTQRRRIAQEAVARTTLERLARSSSRPGFPAALDELISELQAASLDPVSFRARAAEAGPYELELAALYEAYVEIREELGLHDEHSLAAAATTALRAAPDAWGARPVFLYGFDDLTAEQLELVRELARASNVTFALPWEDRGVLTSARGSLYTELREIEGASVTQLESDPKFTESRTLFELERRFGEPAADPSETVENDGGLALLASAGELAEAEAVGAEVARLLDDGVPASEIAIVLRDPASSGSLYRRVLARFEIPVAVQADLDLARTVTGTGLLALLEAAVGRGRASDLFAYLRTPGIASPRRVDWFERRLLRGRMRTTDEALGAWDPDGESNGGGKDGIVAVERLRAAGSGAELLREAGRQARWIAESAVRREAAVAGTDRALELRAGAETERALEELSELDLPHSPAELIAAVTALQVPIWRGPTEGRVRVISPYRARARRVGHVFVASLQDGDFPRRDTGGPLLSDEARAGLALPPRKKAEVEDRYLFSVCLSRPKRRLWLSWRSADDEGGATARSPFVDEVRELLAPALPPDPEQRDETLISEAGGRGLAESVFTPGAAPSERELARAEALLGTDRLPDERLRPGPLRLDPVRERMRAMDLFGPSTLEEYAVCPYRWFVQHELKPLRIGPEEEALNAGSVAHKVLELLYDEPPGDERKPTPATLDEWQRRARELVHEVGPERLPRERPDTAAALRRVEGLVHAFLSDEARTATAFEPAYAEARYGFEDSEKGPLALEGGGVHGQIDRVDLGPGGEALVQDYKSGAKVDGGKGMLERGKLQLQLYMLAARELWALELAGGLYRPLGATSKRQPKGLVRKSVSDELAGLKLRRDDRLGEEDFEQALADARGEAERIIAAIHEGDVGRRPIGGACPDYCSFQPICRRERGLPEEEPYSGEEDDEE
jgi:ATP-dependent helicase/DNAse subunit B